jgi:hypothetical protein
VQLTVKGEQVSRFLRPRASLIAGLYLVLSAGFCAPLFEIPNGLGYQDWDVHLFFHGAVLENLIEYGQLPFWNPWNCGGNVLWQNPQVPLLSPAYLLSLVMPLPLAVKVNIVLHYWLAFIGMHLLLTRSIGLSFLPAVVYLAAVYTFAGAHTMHLAVGHSNFLPALYLPLHVFWVVSAVRTGSVRDTLLAGATLSLMLFNGGLHIVPMAAVGAGTFGLLVAIGRRDWRPLVMTGVMFVAGFAFAAPKLVPTTLFVTGEQFWDARTVVERPDAMTPEMVTRAYVDPYQTRGLRFERQRHGWYEYGNYIGLLAALLVVASVLGTIIERRAADRGLAVPAALTTILLVALSAGEFSSTAPASLAALAPLFGNFRIPSRYTIAAVLFGVATSAWALKAVAAEGGLTNKVKVLVAMICALATLDLAVRNSRQLSGTFAQAPLEAHFDFLGGADALVVDRASDPYRPGSPMFRTLMSGMSFFNCYEVMRLKQTAQSDRPLVWNDNKSKMFATRFSPNRVQFSVAVGSEASRVVLNQNFAAGWSSNAGAVVPDPVSGNPSVLLSAGQAGTFAFVFRPPGLIAGALIFAVAVVASVLVCGVRL